MFFDLGGITILSWCWVNCYVWDVQFQLDWMCWLLLASKVFFNEKCSSTKLKQNFHEYSSPGISWSGDPVPPKSINYWRLLIFFTNVLHILSDWCYQEQLVSSKNLWWILSSSASTVNFWIICDAFLLPVVSVQNSLSSQNENRSSIDKLSNQSRKKNCTNCRL